MSKLTYGGMVLLLMLIILVGFHFMDLRISRLEKTMQEHRMILNKMQFIVDTQLERELWILAEVKAIIDKHLATKLLIPVSKSVFIAVETEE